MGYFVNSVSRGGGGDDCYGNSSLEPDSWPRVKRCPSASRRPTDGASNDDDDDDDETGSTHHLMYGR
ncbi:unnamed protein product [Soboliphyme baturini]|uniref:Uncharacterized protein n=1 Tax=Soboliphyme baturini TaxID=241478 RepID=A0A183IW29_9BILA|nr:unnamed protein product [Soboliphyme baturini]